jgi:hypothetical protein
MKACQPKDCKRRVFEAMDLPKREVTVEGEDGWGVKAGWGVTGRGAWGRWWLGCCGEAPVGPGRQGEIL